MDHGPLVQTDGETIPVEYLNDRGMLGRNLRKIQKGSFTKYLLGTNQSEKVHLGAKEYTTGRFQLPLVLFVGEGNFTFSVAFATLRKVRSCNDPWPGIISTCLGAELPQFSRAKVHCIETSFKYHNQVKNHLDKELQNLGLASDIGISGDTHLLLKIRALLDLPPPPPQYHHLHWRPNIDALEPLKFFIDVIWFQCPWVHPGSVADLVEGFMLNAAHNTSESQRVCLGITTCRAYVHRYELERILGENLRGEDGSTATLQKFHFLGADTELIAKILSYGYHHHSDSGKDIHNLILPHHVTLVFQRKKDRRR